MAKLCNVVERSKNSNLPIDRLCMIKNYLPIRDKFEFVNRYNQLIEEHKNDYSDMNTFIAYVFFELLVVQSYTNIELDFTYDEFDMLEESGLMTKILEIIKVDYAFLSTFVRPSSR